MIQGQLLSDANIGNLQSDEIYKLFWSLIENTRQLKNQNGSFYICPHTVLYFLNKAQQPDYLKFNAQNCLVCGSLGNRQYSFQLSGILYFLCGGTDENNKFNFTIAYYFLENLEPYVMEQKNFFHQICRIINDQDFERINQVYDHLLQDVNTKAYAIRHNIWELRRYRIIMINPCKGPIYFRAETNLTLLFQSYKRLLKVEVQIENALQNINYTFPNHCIHNLFIQQYYSEVRFWAIAINFYQTNRICQCQQTYGRALFHLLTGLQEFRTDYAQDATKDPLIDFSISICDLELSIKFQYKDPVTALQRFAEFEQTAVMISYSQILQGGLPLSFFAHKLLKRIHLYQNQELNNYYKVIFLQETIELTELLIIRLKGSNTGQNDTPSHQQLLLLYSNQKARVDRDFSNTNDPVLRAISQTYMIANFEEQFEDITQSPTFNENNIKNTLYSFRIEVCLSLDTNLDFARRATMNNFFNQFMVQQQQIRPKDLINFEDSLRHHPEGFNYK